MKLKRLLEADDKELEQVQEIVKALPDIFKEAITTSDYFKKRLPQLAKQMTAEQAAQVLDLYVNQDYDIIKVAEKELLRNYFDNPKKSTLLIDTFVNAALEDGYLVKKGDVQVGDPFLNQLDKLNTDSDLNQKQLDLLFSILMQVYDRGDIDAKFVELLNDVKDEVLPMIFNGDDEAYRLKCFIFLENDDNRKKYGLDDDFGFDTDVKLSNGTTARFGDLSTKQMKFYLSTKEKAKEISLIQWLIQTKGETDFKKYDIGSSDKALKWIPFTLDMLVKYGLINKTRRFEGIKRYLQGIIDNGKDIDTKEDDVYKMCYEFLKATVYNTQSDDSVSKQLNKSFNELYDKYFSKGGSTSNSGNKKKQSNNAKTPKTNSKTPKTNANTNQ